MDDNRRKPMGQMSYYYSEALLKETMTKFFNHLRDIELMPIDRIADHLITQGHELVGCIRKRIEKSIREDIHRESNKPKELSSEQIEKLLLAKDEVLLADKKYCLFREFGDLQNNLPVLGRIIKARKEMNELVAEQLGMNSPGNDPYLSTFINVESVISFIILIHSSRFVDPLKNDLVIKFSFDGRRNEGEEVLIGLVPQFPGLEQSGLNNYPIAIMRCSEEESTTQIHKISQKLVELQNRVVATTTGRPITLLFLFCADLKSVWTSTGLIYDRKNNSEFCPCCFKKSADVAKWGKEGTRQVLPRLNFKVSEFIYCSLHAGMRITEKLIALVGLSIQGEKLLEQFRKQMRKHRIIIKKKKQDQDFLKAYLTGDWVKKILLHPNTDLSPGLKELISFYSGDRQVLIRICLLWTSIYKIICSREIIQADRVAELEQECKQFFNLWTNQFPNSTTPYIHIVTHHSCDILREHGSIGQYSQQGFEYSNKNHKLITQRGSSHGGGRAKKKTSRQLMETIYRRLWLMNKYALEVRANTILGRNQNKKKKHINLERKQIQTARLIQLDKEIITIFTNTCQELNLDPRIYPNFDLNNTTVQINAAASNNNNPPQINIPDNNEPILVEDSESDLAGDLPANSFQAGARDNNNSPIVIDELEKYLEPDATRARDAFPSPSPFLAQNDDIQTSPRSSVIDIDMYDVSTSLVPSENESRISNPEVLVEPFPIETSLTAPEYAWWYGFELDYFTSEQLEPHHNVSEFVP